MHDIRADRADIQAAIDREVALVTSAVDLVASGGAPAATVAGLRLAEAVVQIARPHADAVGVTLESLWSADEGTTDIRVHRMTGR